MRSTSSLTRSLPLGLDVHAASVEWEKSGDDYQNPPSDAGAHSLLGSFGSAPAGPTPDTLRSAPGTASQQVGAIPPFWPQGPEAEPQQPSQPSQAPSSALSNFLSQGQRVGITQTGGGGGGGTPFIGHSMIGMIGVDWQPSSVTVLRQLHGSLVRRRAHDRT